MAKGDIVVIHRLVIVDTAQDNGDGTFTTERIHGAGYQYPGETNQVKLKKITLDGGEIFLVDKFL